MLFYCIDFFRDTWMQFFACSLAREELLQDLLTAQYGRLNTILRQGYLFLAWTVT